MGKVSRVALIPAHPKLTTAEAAGTAKAAPVGRTDCNGGGRMYQGITTMQTRMAATPVTDLAALERAYTQSQREPVLLFLDDPYCPISRRAASQVAALEQPVFRVDVSIAHAVSAAVEQRTGVGHASPQLLVLWNERVVWSASHLRITAAAIGEALA